MRKCLARKEALHEDDTGSLVLKSENLDAVFNDLKKAIVEAVRDNQPVHEVEQTLWREVRRIGREALALVFTLLGNGDQGEDLELPDGRRLQRLEQEHRRVYQSIFGAFELSRVVYGSREGQKIEFVPLDNRLQLPEGVFSYVLQDWDQALCVEQAFGQAQSTIGRMLDLQQSVDSLEHMNQQMAQGVDDVHAESAATGGGRGDRGGQRGSEGDRDAAQCRRSAAVGASHEGGQGQPQADGHGGDGVHGGSLRADGGGSRRRPVPRQAGARRGRASQANSSQAATQGGVGHLAARRDAGIGDRLRVCLDVGELFLRGRAKDNARARTRTSRWRI